MTTPTWPAGTAWTSCFARLQILTLPSRVPVTSFNPLPPNARGRTELVVLKVSFCFQVFVSHNLTVPSSLPVAISRPSGEKATDQTGNFLWAGMVRLILPVSGSHSLTAPVSSAMANVLPSGEKATDQIGPAWPASESRDGAGGAACCPGSTLASQEVTWVVPI